MNIRALQHNEIESVFPLLLLAEPSEGALRWSLSHLSDRVYGMEVDGEWVGAATVRWQSEPSEILELAIAPERQRQGLGKELVAWLVAEARNRGKAALLVGTSNASIDNIIFYQKCGFRMDHVRADYFWYYRKPRYENGLMVRDLLVFRYDLSQEAQADANEADASA
jgi:GNAT superfamily N-acetyltransferase